MLSIFTALSLFSVMASATPVPAQESIYNTQTRQWLTVEDAAVELNSKSIMVLGEQHVMADNLKDPESILHHANQLRWLKAVNQESLARGHSAQLGMEFLTYTHQAPVDRFLSGAITEAEFLQLVGWGTNPFEPYGKLLLESKAAGGGGTLALNAPKALSRQVSQGGPQSLTPEQKAFLPPVWELGANEYYERFEAAMGGHVPKEKLENYFWAQSLWDDTMAWKATTGKTNGPLTIVVGEFHAEFGHGLPARLQRYGARDVRTMIQVALDRGEDFKKAVAPDPKYGERADYIWVFTRN
jgi:uncharacterized iron-regulated protein